MGWTDHNRLVAADRELRGLARRLIQDLPAGEDAVQDVWLAALGDGIRTGASHGGAMKRGLKLRIWSFVRGESLRRVRDRSVAGRGMSEISPAELVEAQVIRRKVVDAVVGLKEPYRRTIILRFFEELTPRETADRMLVPVETVRTRTKRAFVMLREKLKSDLSDYRGWLVPLGAFAMDTKSRIAVHEILKGVFIVNAKFKGGVVAASIILLAVFGLWFSGIFDAGELADLESTASHDERSLARRAINSHGPTLATGEEATETEGSGVAIDDAGMAPSASIAKSGRLRVMVVRDRDDVPVPGIPVRFQPLGIPNPFQHFENHRTDEHGVIELEGWPVGSTRVFSAFASTKRVTVQKDETTEMTYRISMDRELRGIVESEDGSPIPGAAIISADLGYKYEGVPITESDGKGEFTIRGLAADSQAIAARARGFMASRAIVKSRGQAWPERVRLVMKRGGASIAVTVIDPLETRLPAAIVVVGVHDFEFGRGAGKLLSVGPFPVALRTDDLGELVVYGLEGGSHSVRIRHPDYAPWSGEISVTPGNAVHRRIQLRRGCTVNGRVNDIEGNPVVGCAVSIGLLGTASGHLARSDAQGDFQLTGVPGGRYEVSAEKSGMIEAKTHLEVRENEPNRVDFTLSPAARIRGYLVDDSDRAMPDLRVEASAGGYPLGTDRSDSEGRFEIKGLEHGKDYVIDVVTSRNMRLTRLGGRIAAGENNLRIVISSTKLQAGSVAGVVVDSAEEPVPSAAVRINLSRGGLISELKTRTDEQGRFMLEDIIPGSYLLSIKGAAIAMRFVDIAIDAGQALDLGTIRCPSPGWIEFKVSNLLDIGKQRLGATTRRLDGRGSDYTYLDEPDARTRALEPGRYRVSLRNDALAAQSSVVQVESGKTATVSFELSSGIKWTFELAETLALGPDEGLRFVFLDHESEYLTEQWISPKRIKNRRYAIRLPEGRHTLEIHFPNGECRTRTLDSPASSVVIID